MSKGFEPNYILNSAAAKRLQAHLTSHFEVMNDHSTISMAFQETIDSFSQPREPECSLRRNQSQECTLKGQRKKDGLSSLTEPSSNDFDEWFFHYCLLKKNKRKRRTPMVDFIQKLTKKFHKRKELYEETCFVSFWLKLAEMVKDTEAVFAFMHHFQIGAQSFEFYEKLCGFYESHGQFVLAKEAIRLGFSNCEENKSKLEELKRLFEARMTKRLNKDFRKKGIVAGPKDTIEPEQFIEIKSKSLVKRLEFVYQSLKFKREFGAKTPEKKQRRHNDELPSEISVGLISAREREEIEKHIEKRTLSELVNKTKWSSWGFGVYIEKHLREYDDLLAYEYEFLCAKCNFKPKVPQINQSAPFFWFTTQQIQKMKSHKGGEPPFLQRRSGSPIRSHSFYSNSPLNPQQMPLNGPKPDELDVSAGSELELAIPRLKNFSNCSFDSSFKSPKPSASRFKRMLQGTSSLSRPRTRIKMTPEEQIRGSNGSSISRSRSEFNPRRKTPSNPNSASASYKSPTSVSSFSLNQQRAQNINAEASSDEEAPEMFLHRRFVPEDPSEAEANEFQQPKGYLEEMNRRKKRSKKTRIGIQHLPRTIEMMEISSLDSLELELVHEEEFKQNESNEPENKKEIHKFFETGENFKEGNGSLYFFLDSMGFVQMRKDENA